MISCSTTMDPLSISGSIAGLVSIADLVFRTTAKYVKSVKDAPKEVGKLLEEVKQFAILLHSLSLVACELEITPSPGEVVAQPSSEFHLPLILESQQVLNRIENGLTKTKNDFESPSTLSRIHKRLKWPFSSTDTNDIIQTLQRHRQMASVALSADSLNRLKVCLARQEDASKRIAEVQTAVSKILDIETKVQLDKSRQEVLDFFIKDANPRSNFEMNKNLRHPQTGLWFTESADFKEWQRTPGSRIWISGIPGAGKSVLAGAIITECLQLGSVSNRTGSAYFFCTYRDQKTQLPRNVLSSLASQLARQNEEAYQILEGYYKDLRLHNEIPADPSPDKLLQILAEMSGCFDQVFIVVDGLDECEADADAMARMLRRLATQRSNNSITTALLSRDVIDIRQQVEDDFTHIDIQAHTEDIQLYVASEMEKLISEKRLRIRDISLKDQIMTQLVNGAKGM
ncbi:hypothetical protein SLS62_006081 [Diatrype stigma]|uniref:Nephrocystin 3-like N-terminal domain-containing protein n=1 Tax=Diatrype stigma TaxID=117547 RepID=A0AAN9YN12_9PEZI